MENIENSFPFCFIFSHTTIFVSFFVRISLLYVCVMHQEESGFGVYWGKRSPSNESWQHFEVPFKIAEDVKNLRNKMKCEKGTEIVDILSVASDAMISVVSMFPQVFIWM